MDMTLSVLADFASGWKTRRTGALSFRAAEIPGNPVPGRGRFFPGGLFSNADAMGSAVQVEDLKRDSLQGDSAVLDILQRMGAEVCQEDGTVSCRADRLHAVDIDAPNARTSFRGFRWRRRCARATTI